MIIININPDQIPCINQIAVCIIDQVLSIVYFYYGIIFLKAQFTSFYAGETLIFALFALNSALD